MQLRRSAGRGADDEGDGGAVARRAVVRWAWRLFCREWRQQALVLLLLTTAVAVATGGMAAIYSATDVSSDAEFGSAQSRYVLAYDDDGARQALRHDVGIVQAWSGGAEMIVQWRAPVPGSIDDLVYRAQEPQGTYSQPMLDLREGRYPTGPREVAVTTGVAELFGLEMASTFDADGAERVVVGVVENPSNLDDDFALVAPSETGDTPTLTVLIDGGPDAVESFRRSARDAGGLDAGDVQVGSRSTEDPVMLAASVIGAAQLMLVLVSLVAAAGFVVVAQRRLRQLGILAAIGATERQLRLVMVANGAILGVTAALLGGLFGLAGWLALAPRLEEAVGHRIQPGDAPWTLIAAALVLVVLTTMVAAWWPARLAARVPTTQALSGRAARPRPVRNSAVLAGGLMALGVILLVAGGQSNVYLLSAGTLATVAGVLLLSPLAIGVLATASQWLPVGSRLALRDLARRQAGSGAALAAISLTLGIPIAVVVTASAAEHGSDEGNLASSQMLIRTGELGDVNEPLVPEQSEARMARLEQQIGRIAEQLDDPTIVSLDVAVDPAYEVDPERAPLPGDDVPTGGRPAVTLGEEVDDQLLDVALVYVGTPELLEQYGVEADGLDPNTVLVTTEQMRQLWFVHVLDPVTEQFDPDAIADIERIEPGYSSLPGSFVTPAALQNRGWSTVRVGWLIDSDGSLSSDQRREARSLAAAFGLTIETRDGQPGLSALRSVATGVGMLAALSVLAMTVGLIRTETERDVRTLTATGATSMIRRTLGAATAGGLALLGVVLGTAGAYLALGMGYLTDLGALANVPVFHLGIIVVGVPLVAAGGGWVLAGHEPERLGRQSVE